MDGENLLEVEESRVRRFDEDSSEGEEDVQNWDKSKNYRLPIKNADGRIIHRVTKDENEEDNDEEKEGLEEQQEEQNQNAMDVDKEEPEDTRTLPEIKRDIIQLCEAVTIDPQAYVS